MQVLLKGKLGGAKAPPQIFREQIAVFRRSGYVFLWGLVLHMKDIMKSLYNIRLLDELAEKQTVVHSIHPLAKLLTTMIYLIVVVSFGKYEVAGLLPLIFYPVIIIALAEIPLLPILKRMLLVAPFALGIGAFNPIFDNATMFVLGGFRLSGGWVSFFSITIKLFLALMGTLTLIVTTGMDRLAAALRMLRVPRIFVLQLLLTYRYISLLMEEVARTMQAYSLRAPFHHGVQPGVWGSLAGNLFLRTLQRAQSVYQAMVQRGFIGEYNTGYDSRMTINDTLYLCGWVVFFLTVRFYNIPVFIGSLVTGVGK
ncbi:MAG: Energy-coupling factor transporter transmembrane protein EcfT [Firmicutes bacterium ADurb.Bin373]|nr:MAG: Energy-coupling factor transporter transmembrane protein EcfT [Firmicutes bacterium ADurb.Bin373]